MKKIVVFVMSVFMILSSVQALAAEKIEQIYSRLPEIKVYVHGEADLENKNISASVNSEDLTLTGYEEFKRESGVSFIFMFDCSTSVSDAQMANMKKSVVDFIYNEACENDKFTIVSFGETIDVLANGNSTKDEVISAINSLDNNQLATVLFDAVDAAREISGKMDLSYPQKRMCVVFTDAVDYTIGGMTTDELLRTAATTGTPLYVVAINPNNKESVDMLGQVARASGGEVHVATNGIQNAFKNTLNELDDIYEISFIAGSNKIADGEANLRVWLGQKASDSYLERKFVSAIWEEDNVAPYIVSAQAVSDKELRIEFSENVVNADQQSNYTVKKGVDAYEISSVLYDEKTNTAVLSFKDYIGKGQYSISVVNIADSSMEKNPLVDNFEFDVTGFRAMMLNFKSSDGTGAVAIVLVVAALIVALIMISIIKKRKGIVVIDNKATFADNIKYEHMPAKSLPTHYLQLIMERVDGSLTNLDINIVQSIIFGRAESCEVTIDDNTLSRQHFAIELENDMLFIQNLSQTNGTLLNGVELLNKRKLSLGDVITAGQEKFTVNKI